MNNNTTTDFCFCTLSLGEKYRAMTKQLAHRLEQYAPGKYLVVGTDQPQDFQDLTNVIAFKHQQTGILHCYNDRLFVIEKALSQFQTAIHIDSDTEILTNIPETLEISSPVMGSSDNLIKHISKNRPQDLPIIKKAASKLNIPIEEANWVGESLYIITRDQGKEQEFLNTWKTLASYLELKGIHSGDGNIMALAARKVNWEVTTSESWKYLRKITKHLDASHSIKRSSWEQFTRRVAYHYRLNKARLFALKDFNFYYR